MLLWLIYDISDNNIRNRTSEACKDYGLCRLQKSVFFGELEMDMIDSISVKMADILDDVYKHDGDSIIMLPICKTCIHKKIVIGKEFNVDKYIDHEYFIIK